MQRRAAQALAGETADAQLQQLVDDAAVAGTGGANAVSTVLLCLEHWDGAWCFWG